MSGFDQMVFNLIHQGLQMLPYGSTCIEGFAIGEMAWFIVVIECIGQTIIMWYKKVGK